MIGCIVSAECACECGKGTVVVLADGTVSCSDTLAKYRLLYKVEYEPRPSQPAEAKGTVAKRNRLVKAAR